MKIQQLNIHSYGKIKDKEIKFGDNINIIFGKNESGKSTIMHYMVNSFYGTSKNKKSRELSDYDKYLPWSSDDFSGRLSYKLDNGEKFEIYRDFNKKNPKIYNELKEDISNKFNIDKSLGNQFFYEQTKVDEDLFLSTVVSNQQEVKLGKTEQGVLIQKIANLVGTGDDNTSFRIAMDRINRRQLDEIGTERSREKPLNILLRENEQLQEEKEELEKYKNIKYEIEEKRNNLKQEESELENEEKYLSELKNIYEKNKIENEKLNIKENIKKENIEKIKINKKEILEIENKNEKIIEKNNKKINKMKKNKNKLKNNFIIIFIILILINIGQFIFIKNNNIKYIFLLTLPMDLIFSIINLKNKNKLIKILENENKNEKEKIENEKNNYLNENKILEKNNNQLEEEIKELKNKINNNLKIENEKIKNKYFNKINNEKIKQINNLENINDQINYVQNKLNETKIHLHKLDFDKENVNPKVDNLIKIEEKIVNNNEKIVNLRKLEKSMNMAKEILLKAYEKMKNTVTPKFTENLSKNINNITNGKYTNVVLQDDNGLIVELKNGNYVEANRLSIGTIDQLYLSLRLSMIEELSNEKMPIILDEAFAYYDTTRLENILKYLYSVYPERQIIIFTCTEREKNILEKNNIKYNYINL